MDEMGALLERWRIDEAEAATDVPGADATGAGTLARAMVAGAGLDGRGGSPGVGQGCPHHWPMDHGICGRRSGGRCLLSSREVPPRAERGSAGRIEGGGAGVAIASRHRPIQLELEGGAAICVGPLRLSLSRSSCLNYLHRVGVCAETPQEAVGQGGPGTAGSLPWWSTPR